MVLPGKKNIDVVDTYIGISILAVIIFRQIITDSFGCVTKKILRKTVYGKHLLLMFVIYLFVSVYDFDKDTSPIADLELTFFIWIFFVLIGKLKSRNISIILFIFFVNLILNNYIIYYSNFLKEKNTNEEKEKYDNHSKYVDYFFKFSLFIIVSMITHGIYIYFDRKVTLDKIKKLFTKFC